MGNTDEIETWLAGNPDPDVASGMTELLPFPKTPINGCGAGAFIPSPESAVIGVDKRNILVVITGEVQKIATPKKVAEVLKVSIDGHDYGEPSYTWEQDIATWYNSAIDGPEDGATLYPRMRERAKAPIVAHHDGMVLLIDGCGLLVSLAIQEGNGSFRTVQGGVLVLTEEEYAEILGKLTDRGSES